MADIEEKGDRGIRGRSEGSSLQAPDAQAARVAGASEVKAFQGLNKNAHNGSAGGDQNLSFELVAVRDNGISKVVAARQPGRLESISMEELILKGRSGDKFAVSMVHQMRAAADLPEEQRSKVQAKLQDTADKMYGRSTSEGSLSEPSQRLDNIDTQTMKALAPSNEVARSALEMKASIEKHVSAGPERDKLIAQLKADVTPILKEHVEQNVYREQEPNEWQAFNKLDPKQQRVVIEAFQTGSNIGQEAYEKQIQAVVKSVPKGFYNVGKGLYDSGVSAGTFLIEAAQRPEKVPEAAQKLSESLSTAMTSGVKISQVIASYVQETAQSGDYSRPLRDLQAVTTLANERWEATPLEKRTEKASELIADMGIGSVVGAANRLAKSGKVIDALEDIATYTKDLTAPGREKARQALGSFLDDVFQPKWLTANGFEMPIPKQKADDLVLLKKGDKGLPENVKPSEKVSLSERVSSIGRMTSEIAVPESVYKAAEIQGLSRQVVDQKLQIVAQALSKAFVRIGHYDPKIHGTERAYGNLLHEQMRQNLLKVGDKAIHPEASYLKQSQADWGKLGTSRVDLSLGEKAKPFVSICLKTLKATPSAQQERGWAKNLPHLDDGTIPPRLYLKLPKQGE